MKAVELEAEPADYATESLSVVPAEIGPRLGPTTQEVIAAVRRGEWHRTDDGRIAVAGIRLEKDEYHLRLVPKDPDAGRLIDDDRGVVVLDTQPTPELEAEGTARDLVRIVQQARRDADLVITDRIALGLIVPDDVGKVLATWGEELCRQTLAASLAVSRSGDPGLDTPADPVQVTHSVHELSDGRAVEVYLTPVASPA